MWGIVAKEANFIESILIMENKKNCIINGLYFNSV